MSSSGAPPAAPDLLARHRSYQELVARLRDLIHRHVPPGATVAVVSKGDPDLVSLVGRRGWHFPQDSSGGYVGYHPRDSASAIEGLEALRSRGADFLVLPATSSWWLEYYADFGNHLRLRYETLVEQTDTGIIYALRKHSISHMDTGGSAESPAETELELHRHALLAQQIFDLTAHLVPPEHAVSILHLEGDIPLLLEGRRTMELRVGKALAVAHPPQPADGLMGELESQRRQGAAYLIIPRNAFGWWALQVKLRLQVEQAFRCITHQAHVCLIYALDPEER